MRTNSHLLLVFNYQYEYFPDLPTKKCSEIYNFINLQLTGVITTILILLSLIMLNVFSYYS